MCTWNTYVFFLVASDAFRDGLICNPYAPAQSKQTFSFSHFFWKVGPTRPHLGSILETIFMQNVILGRKKALQKNTLKSCPGRLKQHPIPMSRGSRAATPKSKIVWVRNNNQQETAIWARNRNSCSFLDPFLSYCPEMSYALELFCPVVIRLQI